MRSAPGTAVNNKDNQRRTMAVDPRDLRESARANSLLETRPIPMNSTNMVIIPATLERTNLGPLCYVQVAPNLGKPHSKPVNAMKMNFRNESRVTHSGALPKSPSLSRSGRFKHLLLPFLTLVAGYIVFSASASVLLIIGGMCVGLIAIATAVCIYVQNNTW
jgi:hypothetical protein